MDRRDVPDEVAQGNAILSRRAAALARPVPVPRTDLTPVLEFALAQQGVAIELSCVREVRLHRPCPPLPLPQPFVAAIVGLHGRMLPLLDLGGILGLPAAAAAPRHLVVLGGERATFAVAAGELHGVRAISLDDAARRAAPLAEGRAELVKGLTPEAHLVLDSQRLLAFLPTG